MNITSFDVKGVPSLHCTSCRKLKRELGGIIGNFIRFGQIRDQVVAVIEANQPAEDQVENLSLDPAARAGWKPDSRTFTLTAELQNLVVCRRAGAAMSAPRVWKQLASGQGRPGGRPLQ